METNKSIETRKINFICLIYINNNILCVKVQKNQSIKYIPQNNAYQKKVKLKINNVWNSNLFIYFIFVKKATLIIIIKLFFNIYIQFLIM